MCASVCEAEDRQSDWAARRDDPGAAGGCSSRSCSMLFIQDYCKLTYSHEFLLPTSAPSQAYTGALIQIDQALPDVAQVTISGKSRQA